jgi:adenosylcobinamide-GDP ribazoletransferase
MLRSDLAAAFTLLTRLPVARLARLGDVADTAHCVWAFPVVGLAVGLAGGFSYWLPPRLGAPPVLAATWSLAATVVVTGGLHDDGLADTADGFGGGSTPARKLDIMRDSRIGTYGALALLLSSLMRLSAIVAIDLPGAVLTGLILAGMLGRAAIVLMLMPPARADGLGASMGRPRMVGTVQDPPIFGRSRRSHLKRDGRARRWYRGRDPTTLDRDNWW